MNRREIRQMFETDDTALYFQNLKNTESPTWGQHCAYRAWQDNTENNTSAFEVRELPYGHDITVDIPEFVKTLREAGIDHFVVTDESTALMRGLHALNATGCVIEGTATVARKRPYGGEETHIGLEIRI